MLRGENASFQIEAELQRDHLTHGNVPIRGDARTHSRLPLFPMPSKDTVLYFQRTLNPAPQD